MGKKPQIGISLRSLDHSGEDILERIKEVEVFKPDSIELMGFNMDLIRNGKILFEKTEKIRKILSVFKYKKTIHGPLSVNFLDKFDILERHAQICISYINLAKNLGLSSIVIHTGFCDENDRSSLKTKYLKQSEFLKKMADLAGKNEITILVENIFPFFENAHTAIPSFLRDELSKINHPFLKGCLDVSHAYIACKFYKEDFMQNIRDFGSYSKHWHVHDSYGKSDVFFKPYNKSDALAYGIGDLHLPLGDADLPWKKIMKIAKPDKQTVLNIELNPRFWIKLGKCFEFLRKLIKEM